MCSNRRGKLLVGSVKTNIGHLESAAGIAGVIKALLAIQHGRIPAHLHLRKPNHDVAWNELPIEIPTQAIDWPTTAERVAGVSSFGFSGTNAHVIVAQAPTRAAAEPVVQRAWQLLPLAAKTPSAVEELARRYAETLAAGADAAAVCGTAATGRAHLRERLAVVADTSESLARGLREGVRIEPRPRARRAAVDVEPVFLFTGSGAQSAGMGRELYASSPVFRRALDECAEILRGHLDVPLRSIIDCVPSDEERLLQRTGYAHPALFSLEYALAALWRSWGIEPAAVVGHSLGEYVAACVAGVFTLEDALRLVAVRARLIDSLPAGGGMLAVLAPVAAVREALLPFDGRLEIAAINAPESIVVSGRAADLETLAAACAARSVGTRQVRVSHAFHSALLEPILGELEREASAVAMRVPQIPLLSNVSGAPFSSGEAPTPQYWARHARAPVLFAASMEKLFANGYRWFVEIGPHPTLLPLLEQTLAGDDILAVASLRRGVHAERQMLEALGMLYVHGAQVDWRAFAAPFGDRAAAAPTYPFERKRFWIDAAKGMSRPAGAAVHGQPLLAERTAAPLPTFRATFDSSAEPFAFEHRLGGAAMLSAPLFAELAFEAATIARGAAPSSLGDLVISAPLVLAEDAATDVYVTVVEQPDGADEVLVIAGDPGTIHARVRCVRGSGPLAPVVEPLGLDTVCAGGYTVRDASSVYTELALHGVELGPRVALIRELWHGADDAVAKLAPAGDARYLLHPAVADAALQVFGTLVSGELAGGGDAYMLAGIERWSVRAAPRGEVLCRVRLRPVVAARERVADIVLYDTKGAAFAEFRGVRLQRALASTRAGKPPDAWGYEVRWPVIEPAGTSSLGTASLFDFDRVAAAAAKTFALAVAEHELDVYDHALPAVDALARGYIRTAFADLGLGEPTFTRGAALAALAPQHHRLFDRLCAILEDGGDLVADSAGYAWRPAASLPAPAALARQYPACKAELALLERCGRKLADVLRGAINPIALLFSAGTSDSLRTLYRETPFARTMNRALASAIESALATVPAERPIRILEIGAGTGGTTAFVLPQLGSRRVSYWFTDVSPAFLENAAQELAAFPFVQYRLFDIERDPAAQDLPTGSFDVVIAANAIHATRDIAAAVGHARALLAPGGALLLLEGTTREPWVDLTFGLTDGWWRFADGHVRNDYPLLDRDGWRGLLPRVGFEGVRIVPETASGRGHSQAVILARAPAHAAARRNDAASRQWVIAGDGDGIAAALVTALAGRAVRMDLTGAGPPLRLSDLGTNDALEVIYLGAVSADDPTRCAAAALEFLQAFGRLATPKRRVWLVTRAAVPIGDTDLNPTAAPVWGLGRGYAVEHPETWGGLIDVEGDPAAAAWNIVEQVLNGGDEDQVGFRALRRHAARLDRSAAPVRRLQSLDAAGAYLVTGGLGGLGLATARWLARRGARHLVLVSRSPLATRSRDDAVRREIEALEAEGVSVRAVEADVADRTAMAAVIASLDADGMPLRGIVHCAAAISAAPLLELSSAQMRDMLSAKITGTRVLAEIADDHELDLFVLFSSTTALLGVRGLAHYAAANAFMDGFAHWRSRQGRPTLAVNWGTWETMRIASAADRESFLRGGLKPMVTERALDWMDGLLATGAVQSTVANIDWDRLKAVYEAKRRRPLLEVLGSVPSVATGAASAASAPSTATRAGDAAWREQLLTVLPAARRDALTERVVAAVSDVLKLAPGRLADLGEGFFDLGMDSLMAVELKNRLEKDFDWRLPATLAFNYPNVDAVARYLEQQLFVDSSDSAAVPTSSAPREPLRAPVEVTEDLSDDALEQRLLEKLRGLGFQ